MKVKKRKQAKKNLAVYFSSFGFREPLRVLVDGNFAHAALQNKIFVKELLPKILSCPTNEVVTKCVVDELRGMGEDFMGAVLVMKNYDRRKCKHSTSVPASDCIKELIGTSNPHKYAVATQDTELRAHLRQVPGVPLIYIKYGQMILEPASEATLLAMNQAEKNKLLPKRSEMVALSEAAKKQRKDAKGDSSLLEKKAGGGVTKSKNKQKKKVKKGPPQPNPLSCLKKKTEEEKQRDKEKKERKKLLKMQVEGKEP